MKKKYFFFILTLFIVMNGCKQRIMVKYPVTKTVDTVDTYFGTKVADPYRWLENDTSKETEAWVEAENAVTNQYLSQIPFRDKIKERLTKMWNYPRYGIPFRQGPYYFYFKNDGLQNQSVFYVLKGLKGNARVLLDPNKFSSDGTVALTQTAVSHDGKYLAYSIAKSGSDWNEIHVMEIESGKMLPDTLRWVKFSGMSWQADGFYYSRYDEPKKGMELSRKNENHKVYFHKVGTSQKEDQLIYRNSKFPLRNYGADVTEDERFLILYESESTSGTMLYYRDLTKKNMPFKQLTEGFDFEYNVVDNVGEKLLVVTNYKAPKKKLVLMDPQTPEPRKWKTIIPERDDVLESVTLAGEMLISEYMQNATSKAFIYNLQGKFIDEMKLPGIGTLAGFKGKKGDNIAFYGYTSFTFPMTVFKFNVQKNYSEVYTRPEIGFNPDLYEVSQVFYASKDKTTIPMFLIHKKGLLLNGKNPTLLYGYGGFNISLTPSFSLSRMIFLENGGVYAIANIRGGGEYGEDWHKAGTKSLKQNVFDDFIAGAEYLISEKYSSPELLAIMGGSNGGLLIGACMTQRPDLFKVAIPQVGVMDMLRYHKFTIGWAWASDYGTSDTKEGFDYLIKYSPLHNLKDGVQYPATLAFTADHDDRVVPAHTFKFIATLQAKQKGNNPVLVRIETKAGHGAGMPITKQIAETTDLWSFVFFNLGMKFKE
ncbi:MAG: prolyl oligopeptidase family serine peptidase [Bacteroidales bacterium]|nr:prolyl oligopeptidase family serine peptidase [Bacteroidales bacterium]